MLRSKPDLSIRQKQLLKSGHTQLAAAQNECVSPFNGSSGLASASNRELYDKIQAILADIEHLLGY